MAKPATRRTANVRLSFHRAFGTIVDAEGRNVLTVDTVDAMGAADSFSFPVYFDDLTADPDDAGDRFQNPDRAFAIVSWIEEGAGAKGYSIVQIDVYVRVGAKGTADYDGFGVVADDVADTIADIFQGRSANNQKGWIPVYDFSDPTAPVQVDNCILVAPRGTTKWGEPEQRRRLQTIQSGWQRIVMRYSMRLSSDGISGANYV